MSDDPGLRALLDPQSIAIIGASSDSTKISGRILAYLHHNGQRYGFRGQLFPVNPNREVVQGLVAYPDLEAIPGKIDCAIVVLPAEQAPDAVRRCVARGIRSVMVLASGFAENGPAGAELQADLLLAAAGTRMLGPNCLGVVNLWSGLTATFTTALDQLELLPGAVALVSQSGAFGSMIFGVAQALGLGLAYLVSTGNEADITVAEVIQALLEDERVGAVIGYVEGLRDGDRLIAAGLRALQLDKPIALVKAGATSAGARAASSHTGSLAGEDLVFDGVFRQLGIARARGMEELLDLGQIFATGQRMAGPRATVVTISGGAGVLVADLCQEAGLTTPEWSPEWQAEMASKIPKYGSARNPIDVTATMVSQLDRLEGVLELCAQHPETDVVLVVLGNVALMEAQVVGVLARVQALTSKPVVVVWVGGSASARRQLEAVHVPCFSDPGRAVRAISVLYQWSRRREGERPLALIGPHPQRKRAAERLLANAAARPARRLDEHESKQLLSLYGVPVVEEQDVSSTEEAVAAAQALALPVAVKLLDADITHKTEVGGVRLNLISEAQVEKAATELLDAGSRLGMDRPRLIVQRSLPQGLELIVGAKADPSFGPVVLVGIGGILADALGDVVVARAPITPQQAEELLDHLRGRSVFGAVPGRPARDREAACEVIASVSELAAELHPQISEMDLNPLIVGERGAVVVDALVQLTHSAGHPAGARQSQDRRHHLDCR